MRATGRNQNNNLSVLSSCKKKRGGPQTWTIKRCWISAQKTKTWTPVSWESWIWHLHADTATDLQGKCRTQCKVYMIRWSIHRWTVSNKKFPMAQAEQLHTRRLWLVCARNMNTLKLFDAPVNSTVDAIGSKFVVANLTAMKYFRMTVMFSVLTDGRQLIPSVSLKIKIY